jgi:Flp pilus assembly protein TadG
LTQKLRQMCKCRLFKCRLFKCSRGTAILEFALTAPLFLMFLFAIMEFGRIAFTQGVLLYAAQDATRYAVVNYGATNDQIKTQVLNHIVTLNPAQITALVVTGPIDTTDKTQLVTVQISYQFQFLLPLVPSTPIILTGSSKGFISQA